MDVEKVFHMTGGVGNTSYAQNSSLQKKASDMAKHITLETIEDLYLSTTPKSIGIADLGCSSGPNALSIIREIVKSIEWTSSHKANLQATPPEFRVYLNDLPMNDFNTIFKSLPEFYRELKKGRDVNGGPRVYVAAYPGNFYGRLFPDKCLHFVYSSYSLHWLSRVPPALANKQGRPMNKGKIYISESSPPEVSEAYLKQFQEDFSLFLQSRSEELIGGGRMVLIFLGRMGPNHVDRGNSLFWELLSQSLANLVSQGKIEEEKLDSFDLHFYAPSEDEIADEVKKEGSFEMERLEKLEVEREMEDCSCYGMEVSMTVRAVQESMICEHFGFGQGIVETLFENYAILVDEEKAKEEIRPITFVLVLKKL